MYKCKEKYEPQNGISQRLRLAYLTKDDIDNLACFVRERCETQEHEAPVAAFTTGVGVKQYGYEINEKLNVKLVLFYYFATRCIVSFLSRQDY